jgi:hypothetical protein
MIQDASSSSRAAARETQSIEIARNELPEPLLMAAHNPTALHPSVHPEKQKDGKQGHKKVVQIWRQEHQPDPAEEENEERC